METNHLNSFFLRNAYAAYRKLWPRAADVRLPRAADIQLMTHVNNLLVHSASIKKQNHPSMVCLETVC